MPVGTSYEETIIRQIDSSGRINIVTINGNAKSVAEVVALPKLHTLYLTTASFDGEALTKALASSKIKTLQIGPNATDISSDQLRAIGSIPSLKSLTLYSSNHEEANKIIASLKRDDLKFHSVVQAKQQAVIWKRVGPLPDFVDLPIKK